MRAYKVITHTSLAALTEEVDRHLKSGWNPHGSLAAWFDSKSNMPHFAQPLIQH